MDRRLRWTAGLAARITVVSALLLAVYALVVYALVRMALDTPADPRGWLALVVVPAAIIVFVTIVGPSMALRAVGARPVDRDHQPELVSAVERMAALAGLPAPRVAISQSRVANAFTVGRSRRRSTIVVTRGLLDSLDPRETAAVLAHELTHVANYDAVVVTSASVFPIAGAWLGRWRFEGHDFRRRKRDLREYLAWPILVTLGAVLYAFGAAITLAISRYREYVADRGSAVLTGEPEQLMSALQKLADETTRIPRRDLRAISGLSALCVVSPRRTLGAFTLDHPPLEKRLAALACIARELGRPG